jgi:histidinol-phosphatase
VSPDDLRLALELADVADRITLARFRALDLVVETKPDLTPVTEADREAERALRDRIAVERPADAVLGEEQGAAGTGSRRWLLDPIDGTKNFSRGIPVYATLVALEEDGEAVLGVVSAPALGRRWWAARGSGAYADGRPIRVSRVARIEEAAVSDSPGRAASALGGGLAAGSWHFRGFGDFWQHVLVAEGSLDAAIDAVVEIWDVAALKPIVEEAGGRLTDLSGASRSDGGSAVSSNGLVHDAVLAALRT